MMNFKTSPLLGAGALALAAIAVFAAVPTPFAVTAVAVLGLGVTLLTQVVRIEDRARLAYRPVYARPRSVHRRLRSLED